jgi:hypothetical protein
MQLLQIKEHTIHKVKKIDNFLIRASLHIEKDGTCTVIEKQFFSETGNKWHDQMNEWDEKSISEFFDIPITVIDY